MDASTAQSARTPARSGVELIGRVAAVSGSQATIELTARTAGGENPTVGKFMGMMAGKAVIIGLVTDIGEQAMMAPGGEQSFRKVARLDLVGEIRADANNGAARFMRGVMEYPNIGDGAVLLTENELRLVYGAADADHAHVGDLQQNTNTVSYTHLTLPTIYSV